MLDLDDIKWIKAESKYMAIFIKEDSISAIVVDKTDDTVSALLENGVEFKLGKIDDLKNYGILRGSNI